MRTYLAGPMRNVPEFNFPAFHEGAARLRAAGHEVFNPAENDISNQGFDATGHSGDLNTALSEGFSLRQALAIDLTWICLEAEAVIVLPGWGKSLGATTEVCLAQTLSLPVFTLETFLSKGPRALCPLIVR